MSSPGPIMDTRRRLLRRGALLGAAALLAPAALVGCETREPAAEAPATEELMREHGLIRRLLAVYDEMARRLQCCQEMPTHTWRQAVDLAREFLQEHHEKLEEEGLFSAFEKAGQLLALVKILRGQHEAGRKIIDYLRREPQPGTGRNFVQRAQLEAYLSLFTRMYRSHAAREDTVLFPAARAVLTPAAFADLGRRLAGPQQAGSPEEGQILGRVIELEKSLGIHDLEEFTPKL